MFKLDRLGRRGNLIVTVVRKPYWELEECRVARSCTYLSMLGGEITQLCKISIQI